MKMKRFLVEQSGMVQREVSDHFAQEQVEQHSPPPETEATEISGGVPGPLPSAVFLGYLSWSACKFPGKTAFGNSGGTPPNIHQEAQVAVRQPRRDSSGGIPGQASEGVQEDASIQNTQAPSYQQGVRRASATGVYID